MTKQLKITQNDPYLATFEQAIVGRHEYAVKREKELLGNSNNSLSEFASGYMFFGLFKVKRSWVLREWAPNATAIYLIGDFNDWQKNEKFRLESKENGVWELKISEKYIHHGDLYKLIVEWNGGAGERIPAWCRRVVQDEKTKIFSAQVWQPEQEYKFRIR